MELYNAPPFYVAQKGVGLHHLTVSPLPNSIPKETASRKICTSTWIISSFHLRNHHLLSPRTTISPENTRLPKRNSYTSQASIFTGLIGASPPATRNPRDGANAALSSAVGGAVKLGTWISQIVGNCCWDGGGAIPRQSNKGHHFNS